MMETEDRSARYATVETWPLHNSTRTLLEGQVGATASALAIAPDVEDAVTQGVARLSKGGRLFYIGAGTSGRIAAQDGVELVPTYGWPRERLVILLAGGAEAMLFSAEEAEDDAAAAEMEMRSHGPTANDVVIGLAASGRTPYTCAAIEYAKDAGALTIGIAGNRPSRLLDAVDCPLFADTGAEIVAGSTRMKAGTAQKAILNSLSTALMIKLGRVYEGQMTHMSITNAKLRERALLMIADLTYADRATCTAALRASGDYLPLAILLATGLDEETAQERLDLACGDVGRAIKGAHDG